MTSDSGLRAEAGSDPPEARFDETEADHRTALKLAARIAELEQQVGVERSRAEKEIAWRAEIAGQLELARAEADVLRQRFEALSGPAPSELLSSLGEDLSLRDVTLPVSAGMLRGAYLYFLGREPERSFDPSNYRSFAHMRHEFLRSDELVSMALNRRFGPAAPRWAMLEFSGGRRLWIDLADAGVSHGVLFAEWEPEVSAWLRRRLRQGDVFLDVGANLGWFTMLAGSLLKEFGGGGRVIGFEPNPRILPRLCDSVAASRLTEIATILPFAVTDAVGAVELHMPRQGHNTGGASLGIPPDIGEYESVTVPSCTLDSFLAVVRRVDFLKLDVEGAERLALDGAKVLLERDHPWIICELNDAALRSVSKCGAMDVVGMLAAYGYKAYDPASERELDVAEISELIDRLGYPTLIFASARRQGRLP